MIDLGSNKENLLMITEKGVLYSCSWDPSRDFLNISNVVKVICLKDESHEQQQENDFKSFKIIPNCFDKSIILLLSFDQCYVCVY